MNFRDTVIPLVIIIILLPVMSSFWLMLQSLQPYGIILRFEGDKLVVNGEEVCKDIVGSVIVKFGNEFQSIDVCELIKKKIIHIFFNEGVKYWVKTLEELGIRPGTSAKNILKTLEDRGYGGIAVPTVSITFWLISEDMHYIANDMLTSLDYFVSIGHDYYRAYNKMLEDPLAIVREHGTILIRSEDLVKSLAPINVTRALEEIKKELNLTELLSIQKSYEASPTSSSTEITTTTQTTCPSGWSEVNTGVCKRENYWNLSSTPPSWFANRILYYGSGSKSEIVQELWNNFRAGASAYLFDKSVYPSKPSSIGGISDRCPNDINIPAKMDYVIRYCLTTRTNLLVEWNHTRIPESTFNVLKPFVVRVTSSMSNIPPLEILITYGAFQAGYKKTGLSIMGIPIIGNEEYGVSPASASITFNDRDWNNGVRSSALIIPTTMKYFYDALIFTWNIRTYYTYVGGTYREYWLIEPIPIITPYYEEIGWFSRNYWGRCFYDSFENLKYGSGTCPSKINNLINEVTETLPLDYYVIKDTTFNNIPQSYEVLDQSNTTSMEYSDLGSLLFGIVKSLVVDLFLGNISGSFGKFLGFLDFTDTTFSASAVVLYLEWRKLGSFQDATPVIAYKITKQESYLSDYYSEIGKKPLVACYDVVIGNIGGSS